MLVEQRLAHRDPSDLTAWELAVRGCALFRECTAPSNRQARDLLRKALARERQFPWAYYLLALTYQRDLINQWGEHPAEALAQMASISAEFERVHEYDSRSKVISAYALIYRGNAPAAAELLRSAIEDSPNNHRAYSLLGQTLAMSDEPEAALEQFENAIRLSPRDHDLWAIRTAVALTHFAAGSYPQAMTWAAAATRLRADVPITGATQAAR